MILAPPHVLLLKTKDHHLTTFWESRVVHHSILAHHGFRYGSSASEAIGAGGDSMSAVPSDRVEILCTAVKDAKCHFRT